MHCHLHESYRLPYWNKNGLRYICVKDATVLAVGMIIFGSKDYVCMVFNQPPFGNSCGPLTVQRIRTSISWQEYTVQLHTTLPILYLTTNVPIEPQIPSPPTP